MITRIDENRYSENDLIQIKLPLNTAYAVSHKNYERCDGQLELNGIQYNYVKRIVQNDTMYLYCVPNHQKTELNNTETEYAKQDTDFPSGKKNGQSSIKQNGFSSEYNSGLLSYNFCILISSYEKQISLNNNDTLKGFAASALQPPKNTSFSKV